MLTPEGRKISDESHQFYEVSEFESLSLPPSQAMDHLFSDDSSRPNCIPIQAFEQYNALETSSATNSLPVHDSYSTISFSPNGSPVSQPNNHSQPSGLHHSADNNRDSRGSKSCLEDDANDLRHKIRELESVMLGHDADADASIPDIYDKLTLDGADEILTEAADWNLIREMVSRRDLKEVLCLCAKGVADNDILTAEWLISELRQMVSVTGEPIQRLGAYMMEGLIARLASSGSSICKALRCKEPASSEFLSYMHKLYEICPYFKFGYMSANGAIAEAVKDQNRIHIIDFQIAQGTQWITLIQALAARPGGPPQVRITGIDDTRSAYARGGGLNLVGQRLTKLAELLKVPFEFHAVGSSASEVQLEDLAIRSGEAIAANFALMLHHMPDESVGTNHRDRLLRLVKSLSPKVVTLVEQECNTNTPAFFHRFQETLKHYLAIFESIDVTLPRDHKERINVEQHCLAGEVVNIVACEGAERVERHELIGKWRARFTMAGFKPYPLSSFVNATIRTLLEAYSEKYTLEERDGALFLGWMSQPLVVSCAWR